MGNSKPGAIESVKNGIVNTAKGTGEVASATVEAIGQTAGSAIHSTAEVATEALKAAGEIGSEAGGQVRDALTGTIAGAKVVLKEPLKAPATN